MQQWWETDQYQYEDPIPKEFYLLAGPNGIGVVKAFEDGRTSKGWGSDQFMDNYLADRFNDQIARVGWISGRWNFAFLMRTMRLVCIDIDGKNGGIEHVGKLGMLPPTLAETSKSGDGYHLFYATDEQWDGGKGYAKFRDRIGAVQGVDVRSVGCVYHVPGQKWNNLPIVPLPKYLDTVWTSDEAAGERQVNEIIALLDAGVEDEIAVAQHQLLDDLAKPIPQGRRNTTLYAIGVKMRLLGIPDWDARISARGLKIGLDQDEVVKILANIEKYG